MNTYILAVHNNFTSFALVHMNSDDLPRECPFEESEVSWFRECVLVGAIRLDFICLFLWIFATFIVRLPSFFLLYFNVNVHDYH